MWPPFVFVLMPFDAAFDALYHSAIKPACEEAGAVTERVDEQIFRETILQRVYDQVRIADIIVAVMSGRNANVFYEVGYAHALGKTVILLTASVSDIPFDLKHFPHIIYGDNLARVKTELFRQICHWTGRGPLPAAYNTPKLLKQDPTLAHSLTRMWLVLAALMCGLVGVLTESGVGIVVGTAVAVTLVLVTYYSFKRRRLAYAALLAAHLLLGVLLLLLLLGTVLTSSWQRGYFYAVLLIPQAILCVILFRSAHIKRYYRRRPRTASTGSV